MERSTLTRPDYPLVLTPKPETRVWGGRRIAELFGRELPPGPIGESWEIHGDLSVAQGALAGRTLDSLVAEYGVRLLGRRGKGESSFPLLTKWLDCKDWLSVQVHPDDRLARELTGSADARGKSEAWYVAQVDPNARLIHGWKAGTPTNPDRLDNDGILQLVEQRSPAPGSLLFTGAGTVHALGPGFLIYEAQQSSDLTYRLYDWGRDRPVHPEESWRCISEVSSIAVRQDKSKVSCRYFEIETINDACELDLQGESFAILAAVQGAWQLEGEFGAMALAYGDTVLLPAHLGAVSLAGQGQALKIELGDGQL